MRFGSGAHPYADTDFDPEKLRALREDEGLTQVELAERIGHKGPQICQWERGNVRPTDANINFLAQALGVSRAMLLKDDED